MGSGTRNFPRFWDVHCSSVMSLQIVVCFLPPLAVVQSGGLIRREGVKIKVDSVVVVVF